MHKPVGLVAKKSRPIEYLPEYLFNVFWALLALKLAL